MPGFNIGGTGGDVTGTGPSNTNEVRRKHRWYFATLGDLPSNFLLVLKEAARPQFTFDEVLMEHNQETVYFAGKQHWAEMKLVWYDVEQSPDCSNQIYTWLNTSPGVVNLGSANLTVNSPDTYKINGTLSMVDGTGAATETWTMYGCWPKDINWQTLDYGSSDIQQIEVSLRYDRAEKD